MSRSCSRCYFLLKYSVNFKRIGVKDTIELRLLKELSNCYIVFFSETFVTRNTSTEN